MVVAKDTLVRLGMPAEQAREFAAQVDGASFSAPKLMAVGFPAPTANLLVAYMTTGKNVQSLMALGIPPALATQIASELP